MGPAEKQRILIIDDAPENEALLRSVLGGECDVFSAREGEAGLRLAAECKPDLILLDIMMPGIDGFEVLRRLKADLLLRSVPVIFITGASTSGEEVRGLEAGAVDFIAKPIQAAVVRARARNHLQLKRYHDVLEEMSTRDGLTGLANRRRFDEVLDLEFRRAERLHHSLSLLMIDIDCFKAYNDHYGHPEGDDVLRAVAVVLRESLHRPTDLAVRYGGEEFVCILPETDRPGSLHVARRIQGGMEKLGLPHEHCVADHVTLSIGIATLGDEQPGHASMAGLLKRADASLYRAKQSGKNRIDAGEPSPLLP